MLNKHNFEIASLCPKEVSKYVLTGVHVTQEYTEVTDGSLLLRISKPNAVEEDFPLINGFTSAKEFDQYILPRDSALKIAKMIPQKTTLPILHNAAVGKGDENFAEIAVTDLDMPQIMKPRKLQGQYPIVDKVIPKDNVGIKIMLDLNLLIPLLRQIQGFAEHNEMAKATFQIEASNKAVRIDAENAETGQTAIAVIMPCRT